MKDSTEEHDYLLRAEEIGLTSLELKYAAAVRRAKHLLGAAASSGYAPALWGAVKAKANVLVPVVSTLALIAGVVLGSLSERLSDLVTGAAETLIDGYTFGAPVIIFIVLAPVLSRMFANKRSKAFGLYVVSWLAATKVLAMLWAVLFTVVVFDLPLVSEKSVSASDALAQAVSTLGSTLLKSSYFGAIYVAIAVGLIAVRVRPLAHLLERGVTAIEYAGQFIQPLIPLFLFSVGVYIQALPQNLERQIGGGEALADLPSLTILGLQLHPNTAGGMVAAYVLGALLVGVACSVWHVAILALAHFKEERFSIRDYFTKYWIKAYPLLWATSSETLATPLNLYILRHNAPWIHTTVRRLVAGAGSVLCTNGTLISVFILLGLVGSILGLRFSMIELLICIPIAFLISFGIPGIPGELLLFAGPLAAILGIPPEVTPLFLSLYLGLQIGLPDSFRTGANTTNNYVYCVLLNQPYEKRFSDQEVGDEA